MATRLIMYLAILLFVSVIALRRFRKLELPLRIIAILLSLTFVTEVLASFSSWKWHNNMPVFHVYTLVNLMLTALYFNYLIPAFKKYHIGYFMGGIGVLAGMLNTIYLQDFHRLDSNAILFSGVLIVGMSLVSLYDIFRNNEDISKTVAPHYWLSILFLFYWCSTFLIWALLQVLILTKSYDDIYPVYMALWILNILFYSGIGFIYRKQNYKIRKLIIKSLF